MASPTSSSDFMTSFPPLKSKAPDLAAVLAELETKMGAAKGGTVAEPHFRMSSKNSEAGSTLVTNK